MDDELRGDGIAVRVAPNGGRRRDKVATVKTWMDELRPDVVHGFMKRASSLAVLARGARRRPVVVGSDLSTATYGKRNFTLFSSLLMFKFADVITTQTELNRRNLERLAPWLRGKTAVIRNGLEVDRFSAAPFDPAPRPFRFASVGSVYGVKNPVRAVEAVALLVKRGRRDFKLDWYGRLGLGGDEHPSEAYRTCQQLIDRNELHDLVTFHGETTDIASAYQRSHALIHPSVQEGFPNAVAEGMASALPIAVSRVSDLPLAVQEADNGVVFDEKRPESIATAMETLMDLPPQGREAMGRRSRALAKRWFGLERFIDAYEDLYGTLLARRRAG